MYCMLCLRYLPSNYSNIYVFFKSSVRANPIIKHIVSVQQILYRGQLCGFIPLFSKMFVALPHTWYIETTRKKEMISGRCEAGRVRNIIGIIPIYFKDEEKGNQPRFDW